MKFINDGWSNGSWIINQMSQLKNSLFVRITWFTSSSRLQRPCWRVSDFYSFFRAGGAGVVFVRFKLKLAEVCFLEKVSRLTHLARLNKYRLSELFFELRSTYLKRQTFQVPQSSFFGSYDFFGFSSRKNCIIIGKTEQRLWEISKSFQSFEFLWLDVVENTPPPYTTY